MVKKYVTFATEVEFSFAICVSYISYDAACSME